MTFYQHPDTPKRARVLALIDSNKNAIVPRFKLTLFKEAGVSKSAGYRILKSGDPRTYYNQGHEMRGRPRIITPNQVNKMIQTA